MLLGMALHSFGVHFGDFVSCWLGSFTSCLKAPQEASVVCFVLRGGELLRIARVSWRASDSA